jgi:hypothetical protein
MSVPLDSPSLPAKKDKATTFAVGLTLIQPGAKMVM